MVVAHVANYAHLSKDWSTADLIIQIGDKVTNV